jgi:hypothetical protein
VQIESADLVLITGKGMEGYLTKLEEAIGSKAKFVDTGSTISPLKLEEEGRMVEDPHWWHKGFLDIAPGSPPKIIDEEPSGRDHLRHLDDYP